MACVMDSIPTFHHASVDGTECLDGGGFKLAHLCEQPAHAHSDMHPWMAPERREHG